MDCCEQSGIFFLAYFLDTVSLSFCHKVSLSFCHIMVGFCVVLLLFMAGKERERSDEKCHTFIEIIIFDYLFRYLFVKSIK